MKTRDAQSAPNPKIKNSSHYLLHHHASKWHGSIPGLMSQICIMVSLCKQACKELFDAKPGIDVYPLLALPDDFTRQSETP